MAITCDVCQIEFRTRGSLKTHKRRIHQENAAIQSGERCLNVERGQDGMFHCLKCRKSSTYPRFVIKHKRCFLESLETNTAGTNEPGVRGSEQSETTIHAQYLFFAICLNHIEMPQCPL